MGSEVRAGDLERVELESQMRMAIHPVEAKAVPLGLLSDVVERLNAVPHPPSREEAWWEKAAAAALQTIGSGAAPVLWEFLRQEMSLTLEIRRIKVEDAKSSATIGRAIREVESELKLLRMRRAIDAERKADDVRIREFAAGLPAGISERPEDSASQDGAAGKVHRAEGDQIDAETGELLEGHPGRKSVEAVPAPVGRPAPKSPKSA